MKEKLTQRKLETLKDLLEGGMLIVKTSKKYLTHGMKMLMVQ